MKYDNRCISTKNAYYSGIVDFMKAVEHLTTPCDGIKLDMEIDSAKRMITFTTALERLEPMSFEDAAEWFFVFKHGVHAGKIAANTYIAKNLPIMQRGAV